MGATMLQPLTRTTAAAPLLAKRPLQQATAMQPTLAPLLVR